MFPNIRIPIDCSRIDIGMAVSKLGRVFDIYRREYLVLTCFAVVIANIVEASALQISIGGIFDKNEKYSKSMEQIMFETAVKNKPDDEWPSDVVFRPVVQNKANNDSLAVAYAVCLMLNESAIAVFGPQSAESAAIVKSISDAKEIPHIQTRYDSKQNRSLCGVNLYPHPSTLSKAYADVIKTWQWKNFVIVYEDNESLIRISDLLKPENNDNAGVQVFQLPPNSTDYRNVFRKIRKAKETNVLLDCSIEKLPEVLKQIQQTGLMIEDYHYIVTCLDLHTLDLEQYKYSGVNITGFRLVNPSKPYVRKIMERFPFPVPENIKVEAALMYDAVTLFKKTFIQFKNEPNDWTIGNVHRTRPYKFIPYSNVPDCYSQNSWKAGYSIVNELKVNEMFGLTGLVKFDYEGFRSNIELQIIELTEAGIQEKGTWNTSTGVSIQKFEIQQNETIKDFQNVTFKVIIPMTKPYGMQKRSPNKLEGNDRYEGYAIDLIHELSLLSNFKYELLVQENGANGQKNGTFPNGTAIWDGMIGALLSYKADIAVGDITMSKERIEATDFTAPFMDLGIAILFIKPEKENPSLFSFLFPFSDVVWLLVITAYIGMSLQFYVMARISPYEWRNPYPCIEEPEELENQFTLSNSFWFTIGSLMQQGSDIAPISFSTRMAAGIWWFFTLIMVSSYTANLAAFLTVENEVSPFNNAAELSRQTKIAYGAKKSGTTVNYFRDSKIPEYRNMYNFMMEHPEHLTNSNEEGMKRVLEKKGGYAFLMESSAIEYEKEQHCELAQIGSLLDNKNYGIATRKNMWYTGSISKDVLVLQEKGILSTLKRKWWKEKYSKNCQEDKKNDAETLKLGNVGGVFLVLIAGVGIACIIMLIELLSNLKNAAKEEKVPLKRELAREMKFILKCKSVKPAHKLDEKSLLGSQSETNNSASANGNNYDIKHRLKILQNCDATSLNKKLATKN